MDADLQDFIAEERDSEIIEGASKEMMQKFLEDDAAQDKEVLNNVFKAVIYGQNRKRKRGEIDIDEDGNGVDSKRRQRMEDRMTMLMNREGIDIDNHEEILRLDQLGNRGGNQDLECDAADEDECSADEAQEQKEQNEFLKFKMEA